MDEIFFFIKSHLRTKESLFVLFKDFVEDDHIYEIMESEWGTKAGIQSPQLKHSVPSCVLWQQLSLDVLWHLFVCDFPLVILRQQQCLDSSHPVHNWCRDMPHPEFLNSGKETYSHDDCQVLVWTEPSFVTSPVEKNPLIVYVWVHDWVLWMTWFLKTCYPPVGFSVLDEQCCQTNSHMADRTNRVCFWRVLVKVMYFRNDVRKVVSNCRLQDSWELTLNSLLSHLKKKVQLAWGQDD